MFLQAYVLQFEESPSMKSYCDSFDVTDGSVMRKFIDHFWIGGDL
jgi:hypothetical protein